jgi:outer membrane murein-binding lipoprotein Lpp
MNNEIPQWWFALSAVFLVVNIILFVCLLFVAYKLYQFIGVITPKVQELSTQVSALVTKMDRVSSRVEEVAISVKETVDGVGGGARGVVSSAEIIAQSASRQFERFSPFIVGAMTAIRLFKGLSDLRRDRHGKVTVKVEEPKKHGVLSIFGK